MKKMNGLRVVGLAVFGVLVVLMSGCLKDGNQVYQVAAVRALNAVPGSEQLDVFLDQNKLNFDSEIWEEEAFAYTDTLPYKNAWPNNRLVSIVDPVDYPNAAPLVQQSVNFLPGRFYSLYVVGYEEMEVLVLADNLAAPADGKAKVRFVHLSPDAPALDFELRADANEPVLIRDKAFKEATDFETVDAVSCTVDFIERGSDDVLHTFEFTPEAGAIYTVWVKGLVNNTAGDELDLGHGLIVH